MGSQVTLSTEKDRQDLAMSPRKQARTNFSWGQPNKAKHKSEKGWNSEVGVSYHCHVWMEAGTPGPTPSGKLLTSNLPVVKGGQ